MLGGLDENSGGNLNTVGVSGVVYGLNKDDPMRS